jgi:hypothetical protein
MAPLVVPGPVGELSVIYNQAAGAWTMAYIDQVAVALKLRESPTPWGPWSNPVTIASGTQFPGLYGSYMNPLYVEYNGGRIYFTMSQWCPYNVYLVRADLELMFAIQLPDLTVYPDDLIIPYPPVRWTGPLGRVVINVARPDDGPPHVPQATFLATPNDDATFSYWDGDVPDGHERDNPLVIELARDVSVTPVFVANASGPCLAPLGALALFLAAACAMVFNRRRTSSATLGRLGLRARPWDASPRPRRRRG